MALPVVPKNITFTFLFQDTVHHILIFCFTFSKSSFILLKLDFEQNFLSLGECCTCGRPEKVLVEMSCDQQKKKMEINCLNNSCLNFNRWGFVGWIIFLIYVSISSQCFRRIPCGFRAKWN